MPDPESKESGANFDQCSVVSRYDGRVMLILRQNEWLSQKGPPRN
jgi:hypothetical protein